MRGCNGWIHYGWMDGWMDGWIYLGSIFRGVWLVWFASTFKQRGFFLRKLMFERGIAKPCGGENDGRSMGVRNSIPREG